MTSCVINHAFFCIRSLSQHGVLHLGFEHTFSETLKSKNQVAQVNKLLAKITAYNLTIVIHEMFENGISPDFLHVISGQNPTLRAKPL